MVDGVGVENSTKRLFILNWTVVSGNGRYPQAPDEAERGPHYFLAFRTVEMRLHRSTPATTGVSAIQVSTIFVAAIRL
jgi:hypothetical protein